LTWLEEAEEDSETEDEEVAFDDRARNVGSTVISNTGPDVNGKKEHEPVAVKDENGEEVDIDDI
jgi:hypothetical protein